MIGRLRRAWDGTRWRAPESTDRSMATSTVGRTWRPEADSNDRYAACMTFLQAAEEVLRKAKTPLTAREITNLALRQGLLRTNGSTPAATMSAALYRAPEDGPIRRTYRPGEKRAVRDSVRWVYTRIGSHGAS
jgi:hypothetical protein